MPTHPAPFRNSLCKQVYPPPYVAKGVKTFGFILKGDRSNIRDQVIHPSLGSAFKPHHLYSMGQDLFLAAWLHYDQFGCKDPPGNTKGVFRYKESILLNAVRSEEFVPQNPGEKGNFLYIPTLYLTKSSPITSGRDVYGLPKAWGLVEAPREEPSSNPSLAPALATYGDVIPAFGQPGAQDAWRLIMAARPAPSRGMNSFVATTIENLAQQVPLNFMNQVIGQITDLVKDTAGALVNDVLDLFRRYGLWEDPLVTFRQIPDARSPGHAAIQSYLLTKYQTTTVRSFKLLRGYKVTLSNWASEPLASSYGVMPAPQPGQPGPQPVDLNPLMSFWLDADLEMQVPSHVW